MEIALMETAKPCTTPRQRERMTNILQAAREAFARHPFHEVLVEDVARAAGVGKGTIYRYFPDKEHLYFAVIFDGINDLKERIQTALPAQTDPETSIRELVFTLISFFSENRLFFRIMNIEDSKVGNQGSPNRQRWEKERGKLIDAIAQMLVQYKGPLCVLHPRTEAQILMGMVRAVRRYNPDNLTAAQMSEEVAGIYLHGLRHR